MTELSDYYWSEDPLKPDEPEKGQADHLIDCLRYHCSFAFPLEGYAVFV